jgi:hypothetical protein
MSSILVIPHDPMIGALIGELVEHAGYRAVYACADERPGDALVRLRPTAVLVDGEHAAARSDEFLSSAAAVRAGVLLFAGAWSESELQQFAAKRGARFFALPTGVRALGRAIADVVGRWQ